MNTWLAKLLIAENLSKIWFNFQIQIKKINKNRQTDSKSGHKK